MNLQTIIQWRKIWHIEDWIKFDSNFPISEWEWRLDGDGNDVKYQWPLSWYVLFRKTMNANVSGVSIRELNSFGWLCACVSVSCGCVCVCACICTNSSICCRSQGITIYFVSYYPKDNHDNKSKHSETTQTTTMPFRVFYLFFDIFTCFVRDVMSSQISKWNTLVDQADKTWHMQWSMQNLWKMLHLNNKWHWIWLWTS